MSLVSVPVAGSPVLVSAPAPNPVNYNFASGTVAASAQVNSDLYQLWNFLGTLSGQLNGLTYCPAPAFSSIIVPAALTAAVGAATAGAGTQLTLGFAHGTDYVDTTTPQTVAGAKTFTGTSAHTGAVTNAISVTPAADITNALVVVNNAAATKQLFRVDDTDANNGNVYRSLAGVLAPIPCVVSLTGAAFGANVRIVAGTSTFNVSGAGNTSGSGTLTFAPAFGSAGTYFVVVTSSQPVPGWGGFNNIPTLSAGNASGSSCTVTANSTGSGATAAGNFAFSFIAIGS